MVGHIDTSPSANRILLVGHGRMGAALAAGWRRAWPTAAVAVVDMPDPAAEAAWLDYAGARRLAPFDAIVLAVKPDAVPTALAALRGFPGTPLVLSVAAGVRLADLRAGAGQGWRCVRAMTNLAIALEAGAAVVTAERGLSRADRQLCERLLPVPGGPVWVDEDSMDAATALMGSGPAYFFRLAESLTAAGVALALGQDLSAHLSRATLSAAGLLATPARTDVHDLRRAVTSPGGTTAAALAILDADDGLDHLMRRAAEAAARRGAELRCPPTGSEER